ncbi:MAG: folylpolyglutamate synthase/dihydrofolate synthase family protein [Woeseiaceae bacterium]|nr:folylpolyglutamate synthase/dihydrofolate synthase family protein [Woeseiaceae bacterium]
MDRAGSFDSLDDWLSWLETLSPHEIVLGLERVATVLGKLELPRARRVINVAGTNGKGSCAAMLEALFADAGFTTGCYTSPHLLRFNERIRIDGIDASDDEIISAFERVESVRDELPLTYFEFATLAALVVFAHAGVDTLILEVGMGGRLDAVNAVDPDACLITNVSLDHTDWLGSEPEAIAAEKAAVMRAGKPAVYGATEHAATIREHAAAIGARLRVAGEDYRVTRRRDGHWSWRGTNVELEKLAAPPLAGDFQLDNAAAVLALIEAMDHPEMLSADAVDRAFARLALAGRFQVVEARRTWVLDVAHNPAAATVLAVTLASFAQGRPVTAIMGIRGDKDVAGIVGALAGQVESWVAVPLRHPASESAALLAQQIARHTDKPCRIACSIEEALETEDRLADPETLLLVSGSFYLVGPALDWLRANRA